jgi:NAD(P)H-hydrate epimerase
MEIVSAMPVLPSRRRDSNKGDFGRILIVAGSRGMSGAAVLCGTSALRGGAGLVRIALPAEILPIVAGSNPCYTTAALTQDAEGRLGGAALAELLELAKAQTVIAIGPGLQRSDEISKVLIELVAQIRQPMVVDADGLNAFVGNAPRLNGAAGPRVITPHPGEFARLLGIETAAVQAQRRELASTFAREHDIVVVLKGQGTIVTDGRRLYQNATGNPGMSTGGTGDVLTGIIAALIGQHLPCFEAAQLGVHAHGLAGDLARDQLGEVSLIATDLIDFLPAALRQLQG